MNIEPAPCPWCGTIPDILPTNPKDEGNAWGQVICRNEECCCNPSVSDGESVSDDRGSKEYRAAAIVRWNRCKR